MQEDTPAEKAGLKEGDIIIEFNGKPVKRSGQLPMLVGNAPVGEPATLTIIRDGEEREIEVIPGELDKLAGGPSSKYGLSVEPLEDKALSRQGLRYGLKVTEVAAESPFAGAIESGDILLEINRRPMRAATDLAQALDAAPEGRPVAVRLLRRGQPLFLAVDLD